MGQCRLKKLPTDGDEIAGDRFPFSTISQIKGLSNKDEQERRYGLRLRSRHANGFSFV